jgi:uncharacterized protein (DUF486 family)
VGGDVRFAWPAAHLAVPANRWGSAVYTTAQLKTIQEVITLVVFTGFSMLYLKGPLTWNVGISHSGTMTVIGNYRSSSNNGCLSLDAYGCEE